MLDVKYKYLALYGDRLSYNAATRYCMRNDITFSQNIKGLLTISAQIPIPKPKTNVTIFSIVPECARISYDDDAYNVFMHCKDDTTTARVRSRLREWKQPYHILKHHYIVASLKIIINEEGITFFSLVPFTF